MFFNNSKCVVTCIILFPPPRLLHEKRSGTSLPLTTFGSIRKRTNRKPEPMSLIHDRAPGRKEFNKLSRSRPLKDVTLIFVIFLSRSVYMAPSNKRYMARNYSRVAGRSIGEEILLLLAISKKELQTRVLTTKIKIYYSN